MIDKIRGISIQDKCFLNETKFIFFSKPEDKISLVYGKNGSGKSTISESVKVAADNGYSAELSATFIDENQHKLALLTPEKKL